MPIGVPTGSGPAGSGSSFRITSSLTTPVSDEPYRCLTVDVAGSRARAASTSRACTISPDRVSEWTESSRPARGAASTRARSTGGLACTSVTA